MYAVISKQQTQLPPALWSESLEAGTIIKQFVPVGAIAKHSFWLIAPFPASKIGMERFWLMNPMPRHGREAEGTNVNSSFFTTPGSNDYRLDLLA